jgi:hypothetical protein
LRAEHAEQLIKPFVDGCGSKGQVEELRDKVDRLGRSP